MSAPDTADYDWTEQAAKILRDHGMTVQREPSPPPGYHAFIFRNSRGRLYHGARHEEEPMAFMHACYFVLRRLGQRHALTCPRHFAP